MRPPYLMHTLVNGASLCGGVEAVLPFGTRFEVLVCQECMSLGSEHLAEELTVAHQLDQVRDALRAKLAADTPADRAAFHRQVIDIASATLVDPDASPVMFDRGQLLAAMFALGAVQGGYHQLRQSGVHIPTWGLLEDGLVGVKMVLLAMAEGLPA